MASFEETLLKAPRTLCILPAKVVFASIQFVFCIHWVYQYFNVEDQLFFKCGYAGFIIFGVTASLCNDTDCFFLHIVIMIFIISDPILTAISHFVQLIDCDVRKKIMSCAATVIHGYYRDESYASIFIRYSVVLLGLAFYLELCITLIKHAIIKKYHQSIMESEDSTDDSQYINEKKEHLPIKIDV